MSKPIMKRAHRTATVACLALAIGLASARPAAAQGPAPAPTSTASGTVTTNGPDATVRSAFAELTGLLYAPPSDARDQAVAALIAQYVDFQELTQRFFGEPCPQPGCVDHWAELTLDQRAEVLGLLQTDLTEQWTRQLSRLPSYDVDIQAATSKGPDLRVRVVARAKDGASQETIDLFFTRNPPYKLVEESSAETGKITHKHYKQYDRYLTNPDEGYPFLVSKLRKHPKEPYGTRGAPAPTAAVPEEPDAAPPPELPEDSSSPAPAPKVVAPREAGAAWWKLTLGGALLLGAGFWLGRLGRKTQP